MDSNLVEVARFYDFGEAHIARGLLESQEIECELFDENAAITLWHAQMATKGIRLMVRTHQIEQAQNILKAGKDQPDSEEKPWFRNTPRGWTSFVFFVLFTEVLTLLVMLFYFFSGQ